MAVSGRAGSSGLAVGLDHYELNGHPPRRLHIVGGPGSGKTTLARRLAQAIHAPLYELDRIAFEGRYYDWRPLDVRMAEVNAIVNQPLWVTEGIWLGWTEPLLQRADLIVWLDCVPWHTAFGRIMLRFADGGWKEVKRQPGLRKISRVHDYRRNLRMLGRLTQLSWRYYNGFPGGPLDIHTLDVTRSTTASYLARFEAKLVHCQTTTHADALLSDVCEAHRRFEV